MKLSKEEQSHLRGIANWPVFDGRAGDMEGGKGWANRGGRLIGNGEGLGRRRAARPNPQYSFPGPSAAADEGPGAPGILPNHEAPGVAGAKQKGRSACALRP